jgi:catalase
MATSRSIFWAGSGKASPKAVNRTDRPRRSKRGLPMLFSNARICCDNDKMLQARLISYPDAHRYRLGVNYDALPVNRPHCPVHTYHRDGAMRFDGNSGALPNYEPNSFKGPAEDAAYRERPRPVSGTIERHNHRSDHDYYTQPGNLFRLMKADEKERLIGNIVASMKSVPEHIQERQLWHLKKADLAYATGIAEGLGWEIKDISFPESEEVTTMAGTASQKGKDGAR